MAFKIIWTKQAAKGYDDIISYLEKNRSKKEIINFIEETDRFFERLIQHPEILQRSEKRKNVYRGPINRLTMLVYRVKPKKSAYRIDQHQEIETKTVKTIPAFLKLNPPLP